MNLWLIVLISLVAGTVQASPDRKGSNSCSSNKQCPIHLACINQKCIDPCSVTPLGDNSLCQPCNHEAILTCTPGHNGDPKAGCVPDADTNEEPMCTVNSECAGDLACIKDKCVDPCINKCGANTVCRVQRKRPLCQCLPQFTGCPLSGCVPISEEPNGCQSHNECPDNRACNVDHDCVDPCVGYCGPNMECQVVDHRPRCRCASGFQGDPATGCKQPRPADPSCSSNNDCQEHLACLRRKCRNPCDGACGADAQCEVRNHLPYCTCIPGFTGCPLSGCFPLTDPTPPGCKTSEECGATEACVNGGCVDACNVKGCGPHTRCLVSHHTATCVPTNPPTVISLSITPSPPTVPTVTPKKSKVDCTLECWGDDQCPPNRACVDHHCADPCLGRCGANATCSVVNHVPSCTCAPGHKGNPFDGCTHQPGAECVKSWPPVAAGQKKFKAEITKKLNWLEATLQCMRDGQQLATVMNQQELDDIKKVIRNTNKRSDNFWIGGTDRIHEKEWFWFMNNQRIGEFRDWMKNQPDGDGDCLEFWEANQQLGYQWNDRPCDQQHYYICEFYE